MKKYQKIGIGLGITNNLVKEKLNKSVSASRYLFIEKQISHLEKLSDKDERKKKARELYQSLAKELDVEQVRNLTKIFLK